MKYDRDFKLKAVQQYLSGHQGVRAIAEHLGVARSVLRRWIAAYQHHGIDGLSRSCRQYDTAFKLQVLQHMWREELSCTQAASLFDIRSPGHVSRWERLYHSGGADALASRPRGRPKRMPTRPPAKPMSSQSDDQRTREDLLQELEYLRAENDYLKKLDALIRTKQQAAQRKRGSCTD